MKNKIAIYGGSFDPPHNGHLAVIKKALELDIEKLIVIPTYKSPHKNSAKAESKQRLEWMQMITVNMQNVIVSSIEVDKKRKVTTYETICELKKIYKDHHIYLIIGADNLSSLKTWGDYTKLVKLVEIIVASRDEIIVGDYKVLNTKQNVSSSMVKLGKFKDIDMLPLEVQNSIKDIYGDKSDFTR